MKLANYLNKFKPLRGARKEKQAFTLVEIIVILFIISVGLLGVLSLVIQNIQSQVVNKNNIIAYQLAQEGIELVRKTRDTNWFQGGSSWNDNLANGNYYMDYSHQIPISISGDNDANLYIASYSNGTFFYTHSSPGNRKTNFSREIELQSLDASSMLVKVKVIWRERDKESIYDLETILYDWI